ncbi:hypothetical protein ACEPAG_2463 [Sanghuangporus baumii]
MSFRDIRTSRAARQPRSFVRSEPHAATSTSAASIVEEQQQEQRSQSLQFNTSSEIPGPSQPFDAFQIVEPGRSDHRAPLTVQEKKANGAEDSSVAVGSHAPSHDKATPVQVPAGWYAQLPPFLSIKRTQETGRGLWTNKDVSAGTVIIAVKPHVHALSRSQLALYCTACCAPQPWTGFKKCSKCKTVYYCGTACQNADWNLHKQECKAIQRWAASAPAESDGSKYTVPPEAVRCLARIIWKRKKLGSGSIWWKELDAMQSKRDGIAQSMVDAQVHLAHAVVRYMGVSGQEELQEQGISSISELVDLISKFTLNAFTLTSPSLSPIGVSLAPLAGLLNHDCDPNVAVVFPRVSNQEPELQVVAIRDIPTNSELFTSYLDITLPTSQRRKDLKETYNFTCMCVTCVPLQGSVVEDWRERMWCPNSCGGSCLIPAGVDDAVRCSKCRASTKDIGDVLDLLHAGQQALDKATGLQSTDPEAALNLVQNMVQTLSTRLPPSAHPLLALIRLGQNMLITQLTQETTQATLETSIQYAMAYVKGLLSILPPGHPVRAVAISELGKLLAVDEPAPPTSDVPMLPATNDKESLEQAKPVHELKIPRGPARLKRAVKVLQQAYLELCIAFGKVNGGGEVGKSVREMLISLEKELGVWQSGIRNALEDTLAEQKSKKIKTG